MAVRIEPALADRAGYQEVSEILVVWHGNEDVLAGDARYLLKCLRVRRRREMFQNLRAKHEIKAGITKWELFYARYGARGTNMAQRLGAKVATHGSRIPGCH